MSEIKLFEIGATTKELTASTVGLEKELQTIIENNMEKFFGVKFFKERICHFCRPHGQYWH